MKWWANSRTDEQKSHSRPYKDGRVCNTTRSPMQTSCRTTTGILSEVSGRQAETEDECGEGRSGQHLREAEIQVPWILPGQEWKRHLYLCTPKVTQQRKSWSFSQSVIADVMSAEWCRRWRYLSAAGLLTSAQPIWNERWCPGTNGCGADSECTSGSNGRSPKQGELI